MREQKYADVLKKYEEEMKTVGEAEDETFIKETSESLSMTRELKFKDLQKQIDDEYFKEIEVEETTDNGNTEEVKIKEEVIEDKTKENKFNEAEIKEEKAEVKEDKNKVGQDNKNIDDDLYLTTSFKPLKKRFKLRKVFKVIFIILFVVLLFGCLGYFVVRPLYNKYLQSKPQAILETVIDKTSEKIVSVLDANIVDDTKYYFDVNFRLNSNIDDLYYLTDSNYGFRMGVDPDNKLYDEMVYIKDGQDIYGLNYFEKNNKAYMKFSNSTNILDLGDVEEDDEYYNEIAYSLEETLVSKENLLYYIEKHTAIFKELLLLTDISSTDDELVINGETIKVVRNTAKIDALAMEKINKRYAELLKEDTKLLEIAAEEEGMTVEEYESYLSETKDIDEDYEENINVYTVKGNKFVGIDFELNGFRYFYYYEDNGNFDFYYNDTSDEECLTGGDCVVDNQKILSMAGVKKETVTEVEVKYNNLKIATLNVKEFSEEKIEFDYEIEYEEQKIKGDILIYFEKDNHVYNIDLSCKVGSEYLDLTMYLGLATDEELASFSEQDVLTYTDSLYEKESVAFFDKMDSLGLSEPYVIWNEFLSAMMSSLESSESDTEAPIQTA